MKNISFRLTLGLLSLLAIIGLVRAETIGQWSVNNSSAWFGLNGQTWLGYNPPNAPGATVLLNQDISGGARYAGDVALTFTGTTTSTIQRFPLTAVPVNGTLGVSDTSSSFAWSQKRGTATTAWSVNYDSTNNEVQITWNPAPASNRTVNIGFAHAGAFRDVAGIAEPVGTTNGSQTVFNKVLAQPVSGTKLAVTDGTAFRTGVGTTGTMTTAYNATTQTLTVTYSSAPASGRKIVVGYIPIGVVNGTATVAANTTASGKPLEFTRGLLVSPNLDPTFITTDGSYTSTNLVSSVPADFGVTYTASTGVALTTYKSAAALTNISSSPSNVRIVKFDYTSTVGSGFTEMGGITERLGVANGSITTFSKVLNQFVNGTELAVTDGTFFWKNGVSSAPAAFNVVFDPVSKTVTATYASAPAAATPPRAVIAAYIPLGVVGTATVDVNTIASGSPIVFTRTLMTTPAQDFNFRVLDGAYTWTNGTTANGANFGVTFNSGTNTVVTTYKSASALGDTTGINTGRTLTINYSSAAQAAKNITVGRMQVGDISGGDRMEVRTNSLTFNNNGAAAQLIKVTGGADELAGNISLNSNLMLDVRTGGDTNDNNTSDFQISSNISGTGGLIKLDSGNVTLAGNNTYTGDTTIRTTGGFTFLESASGNAISSNNLFLGNTSRDGHAGFALQLGASNQIADTTKVYFDAASGRNAYIRMFGFDETVGGIYDFTGQGVIENTESETRPAQGNSVLTVNTASASDVSFFNGFFRNKSSGGSPGTIGLVKNGPGELGISGSNVFYSGSTTINGGKLMLQNINGAGSMPFNPMTVTATSTGSAFNGNTGPRFRSDVTTTSASAVLDLRASSDWVFGTVLSGPGQLEKSGGSQVTLTNNNTFTGATTITAGTLTVATGARAFQQNGLTDFLTAADNNPSLNGGQRLIADYGDGKLSATSSINLRSGTLRIANAQPRDYLTPGSTTQTTTVNYNNANRISDTAPINSYGGGIQFLNTSLDTLPVANFSETLGSLNLLAGKTVVNTSQALPGGSSTLVFNGLTHAAGSAVHFIGSGLGDNNQNRVQFAPIPALTGSLIGGWAVVTTLSDTGTLVDEDFATYDTTTGSVRALQSYTALGSGTWSFTNATAPTIALQNMRINGGNPSFSNTTSPKKIVTVNALKFDDSTARTLNSVSGANGTGTLAVANGIIARGNNHNISGSFILTSAAPKIANAGGAIVTDVRELDFWIQVNRAFSVNDPISNNAADAVKVVKSGPGDLKLNGASLYTGGTTVLEGDLWMTTALNSLGATPAANSGYRPDYLVLNGGSLQMPAVAAALTVSFNNAMGVTLGESNGRISLQDGIELRIGSKVTGPGNLTVDSINGGAAFNDGGVLVLTADNDFQGSVNIARGNLVIESGTNQFKGGISLTGGSLTIKSGAALPANTTLSNGGVVRLGDTVSIGQLSGSGSINSLPGGADGRRLIINQDSNSTFSGQISDSAFNAPFLGIEKQGKGTLTLTSRSGSNNDFNGPVIISGGVLAVDSISFRSDKSALGTGLYKPGALNGQGTLAADESSRANLVIGDGTGLSYIGSDSIYTTRPFTIGTGQNGAGVYANGTSSFANILWVQQQLFDTVNFNPIPGVYDDIGFSAPNQAATLDLGGRNQGLNRFGMDLHDNGTGALTLNKTGDGRWILGEMDPSTTTPVSTASRSDFTGRTSIYLGTLGITQNGALGAAGGDSVALIGGNLDLMNVDYAVSEGISMQGGRLRSLEGAANAWSGDISLNVSSVVEVGGGSNLALRGAISGRSGLTKAGFGTLTLSNNNTFIGGFNVSEGTVRLDYSTNTGSKLADGGSLNLGGARQGGTLDIVGGTNASPLNIVEIVSGLTLGTGQNRITRSDPTSTTQVRLNALLDRSVGQGSALDIAAGGITQTDRLNGTSGILAAWLTVGGSDWATNKSNAVDSDIVALGSPGSVAPGYVSDTWVNLNSNTTVTTDNAVPADSVTNTLRFANATTTTTTLSGLNNIISGDGILVSPAVGEHVNTITGGQIKIQDNGFGGSLYVHQNNPVAALVIDSVLTDAGSAGSFTGTMFVDGLINRFQVDGADNTARAATVANLYAGMPVSGPNLDPGATIGSIDYTNGKINFSFGPSAEAGTTIIVNSVSFVGDTSAGGALNRVRVYRNGSNVAQLKALAINQPISGGSIPASTVVTAVALDDPDNPTVALLTMNQNIPVPSVIPYTISLLSRNGLSKFGNGTLILGGANTFSGPVAISGGSVVVDSLPAAGTPSPLGLGAIGTGSVVLSGGKLSYAGDSVRTDRGFTINEVGGVEVRNSGVVADFVGNLNSGVGGTMQKTGQGTLKLTRIGGRVASLTDPATVGSGGATNFGGFDVRSGTLQLAYENPNSNDNANRFAASTATLRVAGGKLELVGLDDVDLEIRPDLTINRGPAEDRSQQLGGQFTVGTGASIISVISGDGTTTSLTLQDPNNLFDMAREPGGTVHFTENPKGGNANIFLAIPSIQKSAVLPWATYKDESVITRPGINDFAAVEGANNDVINSDSKNLYFISPTVGDWVSNQTLSEGNQPFRGFTPSDYEGYAIRFFNTSPGEVNISNSMTLNGGAILMGTHVGPTQKTIKLGTLTSGLMNADGLSSDLIIHNYDPAGSLSLESDIINYTHLDRSGVIVTPVNLVHTGNATTLVSGNNAYTGTTYLTGGVLRAAGSSPNAIPGGLGATGGTSNISIKGGLLGIESDFSRPLGTGGNGVQWLGSGGFASFNGARQVNLGGAAATVAWGSGSFVGAGETLILGSSDATGSVSFANPIFLGGSAREVDVRDGAAAEDAELAGTLTGSGGSLRKLGQGTLRLSGAGAHTGGTELVQGTLIGGATGFGVGPLSVGASDGTGVSDRLVLKLSGGTVANVLNLANKNSEGLTEVNVLSNTIVTGPVTLDRNVFLTPNSGRSLTFTGSVTGADGSLTVMDGGTVALHGAGAFGTTGGAQGATINGAVTVRDGALLVGHSSALGSANVELGDRMSVLSLPAGSVVDRSTAGRSVLLQGGDFDPVSDGVPGQSGGHGAFMFRNQSSMVIDGKTYTSADVGKIILVNGEIDHPERNGLYVVNYDTGIVQGTSDDIISLARFYGPPGQSTIDPLDDLSEVHYGARVQVTSGTDAGKYFFLAKDQPSTLPPVDSLGRILIDRPIFWKEEASLNPNVSLQADTAGITVANTIDINGTIGSGIVTLGGATGLTSGQSTFSGNIVLRDSNARSVRLASETNTGRGVTFSGVLSEDGGALSLNKVGAGTVTLTGANTFTGGVVVNGGTLLASNGAGSATGLGPVTVTNFGSALGGIGIIGGDTSIFAGGMLLPGDPTVDSGIGALSFQSKLNLGQDSSAVFELGGDLAFDRVLVGGALSVDTSSIFHVLLNYIPTGAITFDLLDWSSLLAPGNLADRLDLPAIVTPGLSWDVSGFENNGTLAIVSGGAGKPTARFAARSATVSENVGTVKIAIELDTPAPGLISIPLTFTGGTATQGLDFDVSPNPVVFNSGDRSIEVTVTVIDDPLSENTVNSVVKPLADAMETAVIKMGTSAQHTLGIPSTFSLNILDNDSSLTPSDVWTLRNAIPTNETLHGVATIGTTHVAVGTAGTVLTSGDGVTWTRVQLPVSDNLLSIATNGSILAAVGDSGRVLTSANGTDWVIRSAGSSSSMKDVVWTGSAFVTVGSGGASASSPDGIVWTPMASGVNSTLEGVAAGNGKFIAVGAAGTIISVADTGTIWGAEVSNTSASLRSVAFNGNTFVAVGDSGAVVTSPDGVNWTPQTAPTASNLNSIHWDGSVFVAVGAGGRVVTSTNGTAWTVQPSAGSADLFAAGKVGANFIALGAAGSIQTSPTASAWTRRSAGPEGSFYAITRTANTTAGQFVAVGAAGSIATSVDGVSWTTRSSPVNQRFNGVTTGSTQILAVGDNGSAVKSADGVSWTDASSPLSQHLRAVAAKGATFCAVGDSATIATYDGTTWTARSAPGGVVDNLYGVAASSSAFVAVGGSGVILTSANGVTWTAVSPDITSALKGVTFTGSQFVAVGTGGVILTSPNGTTWTRRSLPVALDVNAVAPVADDETQLIAVGAAGGAVFSYDSGITWAKRDTRTSQDLFGIVSKPVTDADPRVQSRFVAAGGNGTLESTDKVTKPASKVFFTLASQHVLEGGGPVLIEVNCSPAPDKTTKVPFTVTSTATKTTDFLVNTVSPLVFNPGETAKFISVTPKGDAVVDDAETVTLTLNTPLVNNVSSPGTLALPSVHVITIDNDTRAVALSGQPASAIVNTGTNLTLHADGDGSGELKFQWLKSGKNVTDTLTITGSATKDLAFTNLAVAAGGSYKWKISNPVTPAGLQTAAAELAVVERLPATQLKLGVRNSNMVLTANAGGTATVLSYRWQFNPVDNSDGGFSDLSDGINFAGTGTKTLTIKTLDDNTAATNPNMEEGFYRCVVKLTVATVVIGTANSTDFEVRIAQKPDINPPTSTSAPSLPDGRIGTPYPNISGVGFTAGNGYPVPRASADVHKMPVSYSATGLPAGLKINSATGVIAGTPTASGEFKAVYITATNPAGSTKIGPCWLHVDPVPANALGTFVGLVARAGAHNTAPLPNGTFGLGARLDLSTLATGSFTGKLTCGSVGSYSFSGVLNTTTANPTGIATIKRTGKTALSLTFALNVADNTISGQLTDSTIGSPISITTGWRATTLGVTGRTKLHNMVAAIPATQEGDTAHPNIPQGDSFVSANVATTGSVTLSGKLADGSAISSSVPLSPTGAFIVHQGLYAAATPGSLVGTAAIDNTPSVQAVAGNLTWSRTVQGSGVLYQAGWSPPIALQVGGGLYTAPTSPDVILGARNDGQPNAQMSFFDASGLELDQGGGYNIASPNLPSFQITPVATFVRPLSNPGYVSMTITASTGLFSGSFQLYDSNFIATLRTVKFYGMVVPDTTTTGNLKDGKGVGFFVVPGATSSKPSKSGRVTLERLAANEAFFSVASNGATKVAVGTEGSIVTSPDGLAWTGQQLSSQDDLHGVASDGSGFVAVGDKGRVAVSTNGTSWVVSTVGSSADLAAIVWSGSRYIAVGAAGAMFASADGSNWQPLSSPVSSKLNAIAVVVDGSDLIAVGDAGVILTSGDNGDSWTVQTSPVSANLRGVTYGGSGIYVAVGDSGTVINSLDGALWANGTGSSSTTVNLYSVSVDSTGFFVAVGDQFDTGSGTISTIITSSTGLAFNGQASVGPYNLRGIKYVDAQWISVGSSSTLFSSASGTAWTRRY